MVLDGTTAFEIASVTKTFTGTLLNIHYVLSEAGTLADFWESEDNPWVRSAVLYYSHQKLD